MKKSFFVLLSAVLILSLSLLASLPVMAAPTTVAEYENYVFAVSPDNGAYFGADDWLAQAFTPAVTHTLSSLRLKISNTDIVDFVRVSIREADASGLPVGPDLASSTLDGSGWSSAYDVREFGLGQGCLVEAGKQYAIVLGAPSSGTAAANWYITLEGTYAGGPSSYLGFPDLPWTLMSSYDFYFEEWGYVSKTGKGGADKENGKAAAPGQLKEPGEPAVGKGIGLAEAPGQIKEAGEKAVGKAVGKAAKLSPAAGQDK